MLRPNVLEQIAALSSVLRERYEQEHAYWSPDLPPSTVLAGDLADSFATHFPSLEAEMIGGVLLLCEQALRTGTLGEKNAIATGFLEALQHASDRGESDLALVAPALGPLSAAHCRGMDVFHGVKTPGL